MISSLTGKLESIELGSLVINVNGVGYLVHIPSSNNFDINEFPQTIYTYLYVREDRIALYGFSNKNERNFFKMLIDTPGIGPKVALNIISDMGPERFQFAVLSENLTTISSISGIGLKLAKKIILELKEKFKQYHIEQDLIVKEGKQDIVNEGIEALKGLGYSEREAKQRILKVLEKISNQSSHKIEDLIKEALKK
ncbi:MAG: Holliday junction branch migration protein RuvA [Atribacterota bacterium]|nr:Holliday junction branch migration protein RuvA [Atribacterota bacterium]MDD4896703.1 Holliday junction branch migration protein RuvA [Atribacterota bacterium]MDD5637508.1 Holliday junction branch migration protein RuvA [Atribacterota bacterium]